MTKLDFLSRFYHSVLSLSDSDSRLQNPSPAIVVKTTSRFAAGEQRFAVETAKTISDIDASHISASAVARKKVHAVLLPRVQ